MADVYAHPSLIDNSPNSLAEAMLVGVPCVASAAGGIPSMIEDGRDGLLYPPGDVEALAATIAAVTSDRAMARRLGAAARKRALVRHDPTAIARSTSMMYEDILCLWPERGSPQNDG